MDNFKVGVYLIYKKDKISQTLNDMFGNEPNHLGIVYKESVRGHRKMLVYPIISISPEYGKYDIDDYLKANTPETMKFYKVKRDHKDNYNGLINSSLPVFLSEKRSSKELFLDLCKRKYLGYFILDKILSNLHIDSFMDPTTFILNFDDSPHEKSRLSKYILDILEEFINSKSYRDSILYFFNKDYNRDDQVILFSILNTFVEVSHRLIHLVSSSLSDGYLSVNILLDTLKEYSSKDKDLENVCNIMMQKLELTSGISYPKTQLNIDANVQAISLVDKLTFGSKIDEINSITTNLLDDIKLGKLPILRYGLLLSKINSVLSMFGRNLIFTDGISSINGIISFDNKLDQVPILLRGGNKILIPLNNPDKQLELCNRDQLEEILVVIDIISNGDIAYDELRTKITVMLAKI